MRSRRSPLAILFLAAVVAGCGPSGDAGASPSTVTGTGPLRVLVPANGSTVDVGTVLVEGIAPPGATVTQNVDIVADPHTIADASGRWSISAALEPGANKLTFRLGDDVTTDVSLYLTSTAGVVGASDPAGSPADAPSDAPIAVPTGTPASLGPPRTFTDKGSGSHRSKAFTISLPARIDYTFSGAGAFTASIESTDGSGSVGQVADIIGSNTSRTWVYGDGVNSRVYLDVATTGSFTISVTSHATSAVQSLPAAYDGRWGGMTSPFAASGDVTIRYSHAGSGDFIVDVIDASTGEQGDNVVDFVGTGSGETVVAGLDGNYAFVVVADGSWSLAVTQP